VARFELALVTMHSPCQLEELCSASSCTMQRHKFVFPRSGWISSACIIDTELILSVSFSLNFMSSRPCSGFLSLACHQYSFALIIFTPWRDSDYYPSRLYSLVYLHFLTITTISLEAIVQNLIAHAPHACLSQTGSLLIWT
jgi:hypothetical protein